MGFTECIAPLCHEMLRQWTGSLERLKSNTDRTTAVLSLGDRDSDDVAVNSVRKGEVLRVWAKTHARFDDSVQSTFNLIFEYNHAGAACIWHIHFNPAPMLAALAADASAHASADHDVSCC